MAMICVRFTEGETKLLDTLCMEAKKSRSEVIRQLVASNSVGVLKSDTWILTFYHVFGIKLTQIKFALRLEADEMWAYVSQKCPQVSVKRVDTVYFVTLLHNSAQFVAKVSTTLGNNDMLKTCVEQMEDAIIKEMYETD